MSKKFDDVTYKPLPKNLTVKPSGIEGLGLHATEKIDAGVRLGKTHMLSREWIRTPLGGFINHSEQPNCFILDGSVIETEGIYSIEEDCRTLYTIVPIAEEEELTVYYRFKEYKS